MNKGRREKLSEAISYLTEAKKLVSKALSDEEDALDNIPENFQDTDRYTKIEEAVGCLEEAEENIDIASEKISEAIS